MRIALWAWYMFYGIVSHVFFTLIALSVVIIKNIFDASVEIFNTPSTIHSTVKTIMEYK